MIGQRLPSWRQGLLALTLSVSMGAGLAGGMVAPVSAHGPLDANGPATHVTRLPSATGPTQEVQPISSITSDATVVRDHRDDLPESCIAAPPADWPGGVCVGPGRSSDTPSPTYATYHCDSGVTVRDHRDNGPNTGYGNFC